MLSMVSEKCMCTCVLLYRNILNVVCLLFLANLFSSEDLNKMITSHDTEQLNDSNILLQQIQVLLLTTSENDRQATLAYLRPLKSNKLYDYFPLGASKDTLNKDTCCTIGEYGSCTTAIMKVDHNDKQFSLSIALDCFPNLCAVFAVGVLYGIIRHVKMWDVLVSSKLYMLNVESVLETNSELVRNSVQNFTSQFLCEHFNQSQLWPLKGNKIVSCLKDNSLTIPYVRQGSILSCNGLNDDISKLKLLSLFSDDIVGIEMDRTTSLSDYCRRNIIHFMTVKAVGSLGDSKYDMICQPTAALLAADCLHHYLSDPQLPHNLAASRGWWTILLVRLSL